MKLNRYLARYGVRLAVIAAVVALIAIALEGVLNGRAGFLRNAEGELKAPLEQATAAAMNWMEDIYGYIYQYDRIVEENNALRAENAELRRQVRDYAELEAENNRYRELWGWTEKRTDLELVSARLVSWDASNYTSAFTISKGADAGIEVGDCVVTEYQALVGQVVETGGNWAKVRTVIDVDMDVGALVGAYSYAGMVTGDFVLMRQGKTKLAYLTSGAQIFTGDEVLTSGAGGAFPAGLWIGTISAVMTESGGQVTYGVVEPACDLASVSQVFIIRSYEVTE